MTTNNNSATDLVEKDVISPKIDEAEKVCAAAMTVYPQWTLTNPVLISNHPDLKIYGVGTTCDVTILVWLHADGSATVKHVCW